MASSQTARVPANQKVTTEDQLIQFSIHWKIDWEEFRDLGSTPIHKHFITAYKNVTFHWKAEMAVSKQPLKPGMESSKRKFDFNIFYEHGPLAMIKNVFYFVYVMNSNDSYKLDLRVHKYDAEIGIGKGLHNFDDIDVANFRKKYNLDGYVPLRFRITFNIPSSAFSYFPEYPFSGGQPKWLLSQYQQIKNPNSKYSDIQLVSGDDKKYFCHQNVIGLQSDALAAMIRHPTTPEEKAGIYRFPSFSHQSIEAILEYFYTGESLLTAQTPIVVEVADFAEQYGLKKLKESCAACLWDRVTQNWKDCILVAAFADLHEDLKCLRDRAFDVLVDNYERVPLEWLNFTQNSFQSG